MTGLEGNRQIYLPERFRIASPRVSIDRGAAKVNRNSWGGDPESQGQIDSLLPEGPVIICFIIPLCYSKEKNYFNWKLISSTMGLVTKHILLNDHKLFLRIIIMKNNINSN